MSLMILRGIAMLSLILLLWNPASSRVLPAGDQPIVLLDASLSMSAVRWRRSTRRAPPMEPRDWDPPSKRPRDARAKWSW